MPCVVYLLLLLINTFENTSQGQSQNVAPNYCTSYVILEYTGVSYKTTHRLPSQRCNCLDHSTYYPPHMRYAVPLSLLPLQAANRRQGHTIRHTLPSSTPSVMHCIELIENSVYAVYRICQGPKALQIAGTAFMTMTRSRQRSDAICFLSGVETKSCGLLAYVKTRLLRSRGSQQAPAIPTTITVCCKQGLGSRPRPLQSARVATISAPRLPRGCGRLCPPGQAGAPTLLIVRKCRRTL